MRSRLLEIKEGVRNELNCLYIYTRSTDFVTAQDFGVGRRDHAILTGWYIVIKSPQLRNLSICHDEVLGKMPEC